MAADMLDQLLNKAKDLVAKIEQSKAAPRHALTLPAPFAELIASGQVTLVVSDINKDIDGKKLLLADDDNIYGAVRLDKAKPISLAEFRRRSKEHRVPDEERKAAWPKARRLFAYPVVELDLFEEPKKRKGKKKPCKDKTKREVEEAGRHRRRLSSKQLEELQADQDDLFVLSEAHGLCTLLRKAGANLADQTVELMDPSPAAVDILYGAAGAAEALEPELALLQKTTAAPDVDLPEVHNPFMLADDLVAALKRLGDMLPPKTRPATMAKASLESLTAFLELEPDFQEASRCPETLETIVAKETQLATPVATPGNPDTQVASSTYEFPPEPESPPEPQVCVCIVCGYAMRHPEGKDCADLPCPVCTNDMVLTPERDLAAELEASVDITQPLTETPLVVGSIEKVDGMQIQTLILSLAHFDSLEHAKQWVATHDFKVRFEGKGPDTTSTSYRFRQRDPNDFQRGSFRTIDLAQGVKAVVGRPVTSKAVWSTAYVNALPDSAFLYIAPGGKKDEEGKTVPRALRYFPIRDNQGKLDLPHLRNAIARIPQSKAPGLTAAKMQALQEKARTLLAEATEKADRSEDDRLVIELGGMGELPVDIQKAANAFVQLTGPERQLPAVLQLHFRGKSVHGDFRVQTGDELIGYSIALQRADKLLVSDKGSAARIARTFAVTGSEWSRSLAAPSAVFCSLKQTHPAAWLKADNAEFGPGAVGATPDAPGYMFAVARPKVCRGVTTPVLHEYFLEKDPRMQGRLVFRHMLVKDDEDQEVDVEKRSRNIWRVALAEDLVPHILTTKAIRAGYIGPKGWSLLPPRLKAVVPDSLQYWLADSEKERKEVRKALVKERFFTRDSLKLVDGQICKVVAKYYLYQPEQAVEVGKGAESITVDDLNAPSPVQRPPTAVDGTTYDTVRQQKSETRRVSLIKYYTVDKSEEGEEEERFVLGEVLVPDEFDAQGDAYSADYVRKAAHFFMEYGHRIGLMHERSLPDTKVRILESYLAPVDMAIEGRDIKKGTWLLAARVVDDDLWTDVKEGRLTGWSIEGTAIAEEIS